MIQKANGSIIYRGFIVRICFGISMITVEKIKAALNKHAPKIDPNGIKAVEPELLDPATTAVITSGAPLANARKVTPANTGEISNINKDSTKLLDNFFHAR